MNLAKRRDRCSGDTHDASQLTRTLLQPQKHGKGRTRCPLATLLLLLLLTALVLRRVALVSCSKLRG